MKLDLTKLVLSGNIPVGFRELTAEEFPSPGDIFRVVDEGQHSFFLEQTCSRKAPYGRGPGVWRPHFRRIENPPEIPETHGLVTAGCIQAGDLQRLVASGSVFALEANTLKVHVSAFHFSRFYRLQPAFVVEPAVKKAERCYSFYVGKVDIPPGFRELNEGEKRAGTDFVWGLYTDNAWEAVAQYPQLLGVRYESSCNPTIRRTEPVSCTAPLLPGENVEVTQVVAANIAKEGLDSFETTGYWKRSYEAARADLVCAAEKSETRRKRLEAQEHEIVGLKTTVDRQNKQIATQSSSIADLCKRSDDLKARNAVLAQRNQDLWIANADLQKKIGNQMVALSRLEQSNRTLCDHKHVLEVKLKDSEAIAEQRRLRVADLECALLKIKQGAANASIAKPASPCPNVLSFTEYLATRQTYREIYDDDRLESGDEISYDGIVWNRFTCGPTANVTFRELRATRLGLFRARRKLA